MTRQEKSKQMVEQAVMEYREFDSGSYITGLVDWYYLAESDSIWFAFSGMPCEVGIKPEFIGTTFNGEPTNF